MTAQLAIPPVVTAAEDRWTLRARAFVDDHPEVLDAIVAKLEAIAEAHDMAGRPRPAGSVSLRDVFAVVRVERLLDARDVDGFVLNNNYAAPIARAIQWTRPELGALLRTRERVTDRDEVDA